MKIIRVSLQDHKHLQPQHQLAGLLRSIQRLAILAEQNSQFHIKIFILQSDFANNSEIGADATVIKFAVEPLNPCVRLFLSVIDNEN